MKYRSLKKRNNKKSLSVSYFTPRGRIAIAINTSLDQDSVKDVLGVPFNLGNIPVDHSDLSIFENVPLSPETDHRVLVAWNLIPIVSISAVEAKQVSVLEELKAEHERKIDELRSSQATASEDTVHKSKLIELQVRIPPLRRGTSWTASGICCRGYFCGFHQGTRLHRFWADLTMFRVLLSVPCRKSMSVPWRL